MTQFLVSSLSLFFFVVSYFTLGAPLSPDAPHSWRHVIGVLFLFLAWLFAGVCWGELIRRALKIAPSLLARLGFGGVFYALVGGALGHAQAFFEVRVVYLLLLALAPAAMLFVDFRQKRYTLLIKERQDRPVPFLVLTGFFSLIFLQSLFPQSAIDPLWVNLAGTRAWINAGGIRLVADNPLVFATGIWDYIYFWPHLLIGGRGDLGLIPAQIFAQWTHAIFGAGVAALALFRLFLSMAEGNKNIAWLAVLAGVLAPALAGVVGLATNDWGAIAWVLFGFSLAHQEKRYLTGCTILGLGTAANIANIYFASPLVLMLAVSHWQEKSFYLLKKTLAGFILGCLPLIIRNFLHTGGPLVLLAQEVQKHRFMLFVEQSPFIPMALVAPIFYWFMNKTWSRSGFFVLTLWFGFLWFSLTSGRQGDARLMAVGIPMLAGLGVVSLGRVVQDIRPDLTHHRTLFAIISGMLVLSIFAWARPMRFSRLGNLSEFIYTHTSGRAEAWIRNNVEPTALVASLAEPRLYYLSGHRAVRVWDNPEWDRALRESKSILEGLTFLESQGVRYILDSNDLAGVRLHRPFLESFWEVVNKYRTAIVFHTQESRVVDLAILLKKMRPHDLNH